MWREKKNSKTTRKRKERKLGKSIFEKSNPESRPQRQISSRSGYINRKYFKKINDRDGVTQSINPS